MSGVALGGGERSAVLLGAALLLVGQAPAVSAQVFVIGSDGMAQVTSAQAGRVQDAAGPDGTSPDEAGPDVPAAALTPPAQPAVPVSFASALASAAAEAHVSPSLLAALVWQESRWHADAVSPKGALGLSQLMPMTARALAVDPRDPAANLLGAARYLRLMLDRYDGDVERALAAYNAGPARVEKAGGVPAIAETRAYVSAVMGRLARIEPIALKGTTR